jgi:hypothetical protein
VTTHDLACLVTVSTRFMLGTVRVVPRLCTVCSEGTVACPTPPVLVMLDWFYPLCARKCSRGSVALSVPSEMAVACSPGGTSRESWGDAPHSSLGSSASVVWVVRRGDGRLRRGAAVLRRVGERALIGGHPLLPARPLRVQAISSAEHTGQSRGTTRACGGRRGKRRFRDWTVGLDMVPSQAFGQLSHRRARGERHPRLGGAGRRALRPLLCLVPLVCIHYAAGTRRQQPKGGIPCSAGSGCSAGWSERWLCWP